MAGARYDERVVHRPHRFSSSRRAFLEHAGLAAAGFALQDSLIGCGGSDEGRPKPGLRVDPNKPWWLQGNFAPVFDEVESFDLPVRGSIPPELSGLYVRNGSNPQKPDSPHWFFGDGMLHGVRFDAGNASWYRNRYVRTEPVSSSKGASARHRGRRAAATTRAT